MSAPSGPWRITGMHITRSPSSSNAYTAIYSLSRASSTGLAHKDHFNVSIAFTGHNNPFTFNGTITLSHLDAPIFPAALPVVGLNSETAYSQWSHSAHGSSFAVTGGGRIVPVEEVPLVEGQICFDMRFEIREGSGDGVFGGIGGKGWMKVTVKRESGGWMPDLGHGDEDVLARRWADGFCGFEEMQGEGRGLM
ncbi:MAG: hypothetical protein LQ337_005378 [Flavoplaca oasis]|nr:MAG: hypothetical protein LQ337_005378 [Flavoplaca oasis]